MAFGPIGLLQTFMVLAPFALVVVLVLWGLRSIVRMVRREGTRS